MFVFRVITGFIGLTIIAGIAYGGERVVMKPRVPIDQLSTVKTIKNPLHHTPDNIAKGKIIYAGKGRCILCHGAGGDGQGLAGIVPDSQPSPRNFRNSDWQKARTDGELKWIIAYGVPGSGMRGHSAILTDDNEIWQVVLYIRSFGQQ